MLGSTGDTPISSFEDLDPEPQRGRGLSHVREFLLGLALILAVLGWSAYQWSEGQRLLAVYHAAQKAELAHDWEHAQALYGSILSFKDAKVRASEAERAISERNLGYAQATAAARKKDWPATLQAARSVNTTQPGYLDTATLISRSETQVYTEALSGTVALRVGGTRPGLYYRAAGGWLWLEGSDVTSRVQGLGPLGHLVYDVPASAGNASSGSATRVGTTGRPPARSLVLATTEGDKIIFKKLCFNPLDYSFFVWGERGVWGLHYDFGYLPPQTWGLRNDYAGYTLDYQAYNSSQVQRVALPDRDWRIMDLAPGGDALLVGSPFNVGLDTFATLHVYLTGPAGEKPRPVFSGMAGVKGAHFSPDQRYVLLNTSRPTNNYRTTQQAVVLVSVQGGGMEILAQQEAPSDTARNYPVVGGTFLTDGRLKGKILVFTWNPGSRLYTMPAPSGVFALFDPSQPGKPLAVAESDTYPVGALWVGEGQRGHSLLVAWQNGLNNALPYTESLTVVRLDPNGPTPAQHVKLDTGESLTGAWLRGGNMVFTTMTPAQQGGVTRLTVRALKLMNDLSAEPKPRPVMLYSGPMRQLSNFSYEVPVNAGSGAFSYINDGQLHARTYDGSIDLTLEPGIASLYNFPYRTVHWLK